MRRVLPIFGLVHFSLGALAGLILIATHLAEDNPRSFAFVPMAPHYFFASCMPAAAISRA